MPLYEYRCKKCEKEFEIQHKMADPDPTRCEECGTDTLERIMSWAGWKASDQAVFASDPKLAMSGPRNAPRRLK